MKFKPVTKKYIFDKELLFKNYPAHIVPAIATWIKKVLLEVDIWKYPNSIYPGESIIDYDFLNYLDINFRERFPRDPDKFLSFIFQDSDRTTNFLALCLQNYAQAFMVIELEDILCTGGSGYTIIFTKDNPSQYEKGVATIIDRVPEIIKKASEQILNNEELIKEAWINYYSRTHDYSKTVNKCVDALESLFKRKYFPKDTKPTLGKFIKDFITSPQKLSYEGNSIIKPKNLLTNLASEFITIRGHHTSGTGRQPTKEEALFVLHYTIFVFSIHK